jgi:hypothetical protein
MYITLHVYVTVLLHIVSLNMIIPELLACGWCQLVHPVPTLTVDWSCHSLLLVQLFIDTLTVFSQVLFGLATLVWVLGSGFSVSHMHLSCHKVNCQIHSEIGGTYTHNLNHTDHITSEDRVVLLLLTPFVGNTPPSEFGPPWVHPWVSLWHCYPWNLISSWWLCSFPGVPWVTFPRPLCLHVNPQGLRNVLLLPGRASNCFCVGRGVLWHTDFWALWSTGPRHLRHLLTHADPYSDCR